MMLNSRSAGILWQAGLFLTGLISCLTFLSTPASAQTLIENPISDFSSGDPGSFAGAVVYVTPSNYLSTAAAQINPPLGTFFAGFNGSYTVTGVSYIDPVTHISTPSVTLHTGGLLPLPYTVPEGSIRAAIVEKLRYGNLTLDEFAALVRAAVGNDGLD
ncbi:hypothetical protein [Nostoc sp. PCC 7107]|uniref:hypothetical protein n=1 Tax=Nostoc sp. PCC 7107 TaxID=317936 RepID=UPI00029F3936|nr:hypothetical protein [Nostoc sp. PCC 7107]AFY44805.1 hypothetical protein Nos7107_4257 [Nostoc sp. PCC 7107]